MYVWHILRHCSFEHCLRSRGTQDCTMVWEWVWLCTCIYVYMCVYSACMVCVHVCIYACIYVCMYACVCFRSHTKLGQSGLYHCMSLHVYVYIYIYIYDIHTHAPQCLNSMYVCMYVCTYVCTYVRSLRTEPVRIVLMCWIRICIFVGVNAYTLA